MDASTSHTSTSRFEPGSAEGADDGPSCHVCGYSRLGLPSQGLCPECGEPPSPELSRAIAFPQATAELTLAKTQSERAWLACVGVGLVLLVVSSISALRVALVMRSGAVSVAAVNMPAPKVWAASLIQRSVGNRPGEWGVAGTVAVLGCVLGVWLVTEPQSLQPRNESPVSIRRLARCASVILTGGLLGVLLGGYTIPYGWSNSASKALLVAVALVELPANTLLYLHLRGIARRLRDRRAETLLDTCVWLVPAVVAGAAALIVMNRAWNGESRLDDVSGLHPWRLATAGYGAAAVVCGVVATAAVVRLVAATLGAAAGGRAAGITRHAAGIPQFLRDRLRQLTRDDAARWLVVLGIAWWLCNLWPVAKDAVDRFAGDGVGGSVPFFNFPGPKVHLVPLAHSYYRPVAQFALDSLLLVWLLTAGDLGARAGRGSALRLATRWSATVLIGLVIGWRLADPQFDQHRLMRSHAAVLIACVEVPLTLLLYLHLAQMASSAGARKLGRGLATLAFATVSVMLMPPAAMYLFRGLRRREYQSDAGLLAAGIYTAASLAVALLAASAITRLAVILLAKRDGPVAPDARAAAAMSDGTTENLYSG